ncbi:hypothetical protein NFF89_02715 [Proteus mirabilis]|uniref:hypothetical protein n=1 Tax=Proteus TaxID=583 RepID=UPI0023F7FB88|nr:MULTISPECIES: hypothetical protein [Proteus]MDF7212109.1 hypothetical protein [Proteus mirabilis]MDF7395040.1 hypothetical protein [Proteus mirabilis]MDM3563166.1 hypothetical protein [Proteus vulgaris]
MDNTLLFLKDNAVSIGVVLTIVGLIGATIGASVRFLIDSKKIENEKKALRQQMITNNIAPMRQAWIREVRECVSELLSLTDFITVYLHDNEIVSLGVFSSDEERVKEITRASQESIKILNELKLLLPVNESDYMGLIDDFETLTDNILTNELNDDEKKLLTDKIINDTRKLLKKEWNVTKSLKEIDDTNKEKKK